MRFQCNIKPVTTVARQIRPVAIVTDGLWRKSLSAIRSLGKSGYEVVVLGDSLLTTGFWSAYTARRVHAPTAVSNPAAFGAVLLKLLEEYRETGRKPVLLPMEDASLLWVDRNRERVEALCHVLLPSSDGLAIAQDKGRTMVEATRLGIPCPRTWEPASAVEFGKLAVARTPGSFVVKPRSGTGSAGVAYGDARSEAEWAAHWEQFGAMLIQERVPAQGAGRGVSLLMDREGRTVAAFAHERLEQYPNSGGPSTDRHGIDAPELIALSRKLLEGLEWRGIAMVEWKLDPNDVNRPKLMEINPRFWGSLELAVRSGVDFPTLYARASAGEVLPLATAYRSGLRCRWMIPGEILRWVSQTSAKRESFFRFLRGLPGLAEEWDIRDLRGGLAAFVCTFALALNPRYWKYVRRG